GRASERFHKNHFLEAGREPHCIDGVSMKATANLIVDPAVSHFAERVGDHLESVICSSSAPVSKKKIQRHCWRKLRGTFESTVTDVVLLRNSTIREVQCMRCQRSFASRLHPCHVVNLAELLRCVRD